MNRIGLAAALLAAPVMVRDGHHKQHLATRSSSWRSKECGTGWQPLRAARAVFAEGYIRYAPGSHMLFQIVPIDSGPVEGLRLTLRRGDDAKHVPLDPIFVSTLSQ